MTTFSQMGQPQLSHVHEMAGHGGDTPVPRAHVSGDDRSSHLQLPIWIGLKVVWKALGVFIAAA